MRVIFQEVNVEHVQKGKSRYSKAAVTYTSNGRNMTQNIMSFTNPDVFAMVQKLAPGQEIEVEITKNDAGYNQWASVKPVVTDEAAPATKNGPTGGKAATVSNYETREERQLRQLHIVRQSSLSSAVAFWGNPKFAKSDVTPQDIIDTAQVFVDFVYSEQGPEVPVDEFEDVPA